MPASTQHTVANGAKNLLTVNHTRFNRRVSNLDLKNIYFSKKGIRGIPPDKKRVRDIEETGAELR